MKELKKSEKFLVKNDEGKYAELLLARQYDENFKTIYYTFVDLNLAIILPLTFKNPARELDYLDNNFAEWGCLGGVDEL